VFLPKKGTKLELKRKKQKRESYMSFLPLFSSLQTDKEGPPSGGMSLPPELTSRKLLSFLCPLSSPPHGNESTHLSSTHSSNPSEGSTVTHASAQTASKDQRKRRKKTREKQTTREPKKNKKKNKQSRV